MKSSLIGRLADPVLHTSLALENPEMDGDDVISGKLDNQQGTQYVIKNGIPRFVLTEDAGQIQTSDAFGFKWKKRDTYGSPGARQVTTKWYLEKYGFNSQEEWTGFFNTRAAILDVGCGSGFSASLWLDTPQWSGSAMWVGADISEAVDVALDHLGHLPNTHFAQADALALPFHDGSFDTVFSEGVLHHTPSTRQALLSSSRVLAKGGQFHFYVYRLKGPVREFTDDYIRRQIAPLSDEDAWDALRPLTRMAQSLAELKTTVTLQEEIPLLKIPAGEHDIQRLLYWYFGKMYWNEALSFEENVHVNFDWYRPRYAHRQTAEEVRAWCDEANLSIHWFHEGEAGYTVRATKN
jgi:arsenite methyltransferase